MSEGQQHLQAVDDRVRELARLLAALGWDDTLHRLAEEIPDARDRLGYVAQMTDSAATKVLNLVDDAQPRCEAAAGEAAELSSRLAVLSEHAELGVGEARAALAEAAAPGKLEGPQLPEKAVAQEDVDYLLASLGF